MAVINGTAGNDTLIGTTTDDQINGLAGDDSLSGGDGNDTLSGGLGADILDGGNGTDVATYQSALAAITINLKTGVNGGDALGDTYSSIEQFLGSGFADIFTGNLAANYFNGAGGFDTIDYSTSAAAVTVNLTAGTGVGGDAAGDTLVSFEKVIGSAYGDTLSSSTNQHILQGGAGNDIYIVGDAGVGVTENANDGNDEVRTGLASLNLASFSNVENLTYTGSSTFVGYGNSLNNTLTGGSGDDQLLGGAGADTLNGGAGNDLAGYSNASSAITFNFKTGVFTGDAAGDVFNSIERFSGTTYNDIFIAGTSVDYLFGNTGNDTIDYSSSASAITMDLTTGAGSGGDAAGDTLQSIEIVKGTNFADTLASSTSGHALIGGTGNDLYVVNNAGVIVTELSGEGTDEVRTTLTNLNIGSYSNVENLTYTGSANFTGYGNSSNNILTGGAANDILIGGAGADTLNGGDGIDTANYSTSSIGITFNFKTNAFTGDANGDVYNSIEKFYGSGLDDTLVSGSTVDNFDGGGGSDTVDYTGSAIAVIVDLTTGTASGGDANGDTLANFERVKGSALADQLSSSTSGHILIGGAGNDIYVIGNSGVNVTELASEGADEVRTALSSLSIASYANVENLTYTGTGAFTGYGNSGNNVITGGAGNDILAGGAGPDTLNGGGGTDSASYASAAASVTLNFKANTFTGDANGDIYNSIEKFIGSNLDDTFVSGTTADNLDGGGGIDVIDYSTSASSITFDLTAGTGTGGDAAGDTVLNFETVKGSGYNDTLSSSTNGSRLQGGLGNDIYILNGTGIFVTENASEGTDEVRTALASSSIVNFTNVENLTYTGASAFTGGGNSGNNVLTGGSGNDTLIGGAGADTLVGGGGTDIASYATAASGITLNLKTGVSIGDAAGDVFNSIEAFVGSTYGDTFISGTVADTFNGGDGADTIDYSGSSAGVSINFLTGVATGGDAAGDTLTAFERIIGSVYADTLIGNNSTTALQGGQGNDIYVVTTTGSVVENPGEGTDEIQTAAFINYQLANNVENLTYTGSAAFTGTGNALNNVITGNTGNDTLIGGAGADTLIGGAGTDSVSYSNATAALTLNFKTSTFTGDAAGDIYNGIEKYVGSTFNDTFVGGISADNLDGSSGTDTADYSSSSAAVSIALTSLGSGTGAGGDAAGDTLVNFERIIGSAYNDTLSSANGITFEGGAGDDTYILNTTAATIVENANNGVDEVRTGLAALSIANFSNVENLTYTGTAAFTGTGNSLGNILTGGTGNDNLIGGAGADTLNGGDGLDSASYANSATAVSFNFKTGISTGDAAGDIYNSIETVGGSNFDDVFVSGASAIILVGAGGNDTLDYSSSAAAVQLNMDTSTFSGGDAAGDTAFEIEKFIGSAFADTFTASQNYLTLLGGAGDDVYNISNSTIVVTESSGQGIDEVRTSLSNYSLAANIENLTYTGTSQFGANGNSLNNVLTGGIGNDFLQGGAGADILVGGAGTDTAVYQSSAAAISFNIAQNASTGDAIGDVYSSIERISGTQYDDVFFAGAESIFFDGATGAADTVSYKNNTSGISLDLISGTGTGAAAGDTYANIDVFIGTEFDDIFVGTSGNETFIGGSGSDAINAGLGIDTASYVDSSTGIDIHLNSGVGIGGTASGDTLTNVENLIGSIYNDTLYGDSLDNYISAQLGSDLVFAGAGNDTILAGGGNDLDTIYGEDGNDVISMGYNAGNIAFGGLGSDSITIGSGTANGDDGQDTLRASGDGSALFGGAGEDDLGSYEDASMFGGEGKDTYRVLGTSQTVSIKDDGISGVDRVYLPFATPSSFTATNSGNDLILSNASYQVILTDWNNGYHSIETFITTDNSMFTL